jgi:hypothetical protein
MYQSLTIVLCEERDRADPKPNTCTNPSNYLSRSRCLLKGKIAQVKAMLDSPQGSKYQTPEITVELQELIQIIATKYR